MKTITLDGQALEAVAGHYDEALRLIEERFQVRVSARGHEITLNGKGEGAGKREERVQDLLEQLSDLQARGIPLGREEIRTAIGLMEGSGPVRLVDHFIQGAIRTSTRKVIVPKSRNQRLYLEAMLNHDLVLSIGPAGTGKTFLAVAMAVSLLNQKQVDRIVLARPAVEAGERLGFLPGDIAAKVDPYLRPLYDALYVMLEHEHADRLLERETIEVAPLAFMRGRTLHRSFVILDEAQNATSEQMKMFLTRIGMETKAVVTGDVTQIDLPSRQVSGLVEARKVLAGIEEIHISEFDETDVVRHPLVRSIILAYDRHEAARDRVEQEEEG
jgi:phosphate starvation-inducible PhoH-like protein